MLDRAVLTPDMAGIEKSARRTIAMLPADPARREQRHPHLPQQPSLRKDKSTALRATTDPPRPAKVTSKGKSAVHMKCLNRPLKAPPTGHSLLIKIFGPGSHQQGGNFRIYTDRKIEKISVSTIVKEGGYGTHHPVSLPGPGQECHLQEHGPDRM